MTLGRDVEQGIRRAGWWGFFVACVLLAIPILIRVSFGVFDTTVGLALVAELTLLVALPLLAMAASFLALLRQGTSLYRAMVISTAVALPVAVGLSLVIELIEERVPALSTAAAAFDAGLSHSVIISLSDSLPIVAAVAGAFFFPAAIRLLREREETLQRDVDRLELARLRGHLEPHFVLNTLNAIAGLTVEAPEQARELVATLGDLLRTVTEAPPTRTVREEVEWLKRYVRVFELRFPEQLAVSWEVSSSVVERSVPSMLWQPLVENALQHGALKAVGGGCLRIVVREEAGRVSFEVRDNGPALGRRREGGRGVSLVERRLELAGAAPLTLERIGSETVARVAT